MSSLANDYRPQIFEEVCGQKYVKLILQKQIELKRLKNAYIFQGPSGTGKTTIARIFAKAINGGCGSVIEIDGASNNGVDNIKTIIATASERALDCDYKVIIIDEAHMLTIQAWNALLKTIEEPPMYTIFIFCTTESKKIPATIENRCFTLNFNKISSEDIEQRLSYICDLEGYSCYNSSCRFISMHCKNQLRDAISMLEKVLTLSDNELDINKTIDILGFFEEDIFLNLVEYLLKGDIKEIISLIDYVSIKGLEAKVFVNSFINFIMEIMKYILFDDFSKISFNNVNFTESQISKFAKFENSITYYNYYLDNLVELKNMLNYDSDPYITIKAIFIKMGNLK